MNNKLKEDSYENWKKMFNENVRYDEAELGCNWSMDDLQEFTKQTIDKALSSQLEQVQGMIVKLIVTNYDEDFGTCDYKAIACGVLKLKLKK